MVGRVGAGIAGIGCVASMMFGAGMARAEPSGLEQALQAKIAREMREVPTSLAGDRFEEAKGIARVVFRVGPDGRTSDVRISKRSGSAAVDREAVHLISSFKGLPAGDPGKDVYAVLQYGGAGDVAGSSDMRAALDRQVVLARADAAENTRLAHAAATDVKVAGRSTSGAVALSFNSPGDASR